MANTLLTLGGITRKALQLFKNSNAFLQIIDRQYDNSFAVTGAKIGSTLRVRLPNDPTVRVGATAVPQAITEKSMTITVASQIGVDLGFGAAEMALSMDDFSDRYLAPSITNVAGAIAADVMTSVESVPNIVHAVDGSNNTTSPTAATWLQAGAVLDNLSAPRGNRKAILDPLTSARTVTSLLGLFNPSPELSKQYKAGTMGASGGTLGIDDWRMDQTVIKHTTGAYSTLGTVAAGGVTYPNATGCTVATSALAGPLNAGDIVTFAGVHQANRITNASTGVLAQFAVTANAAASATSIQVYPALIGAIAGVAQPYQTTDLLPATGAAIASPVNASETYRKNIVFCPEAFTLVTADLALPTGAVVDCAREQFDGISLRIVRDFLTLTDVFVTRLDILYGFASPRPEWAVIVADAL